MDSKSVKICAATGVFAILAVAAGYFLEGLSRDSKTASMDALRLSAERGDAVAQMRLGLIYAKGVDTAQDYDAAAFWFKKSASQGNVDAEIFLDALAKTIALGQAPAPASAKAASPP